MKNISFFKFMSLLISLAGVFVGGYAIFTSFKLIAFKQPPGFTVAEYHEWLRTHTSLEDLRTVAVNGDNAVDALSSNLLTISLWLIGLGVLNTLIVGYDMFKKSAKNSTSSG